MSTQTLRLEIGFTERSWSVPLNSQLVRDHRESLVREIDQPHHAAGANSDPPRSGNPFQRELDSPFKTYPRAEIVESPFLQLEYANPDSRDQDTWIAEARDRPASTRATISGQYILAVFRSVPKVNCTRQLLHCTCSLRIDQS